MGPAVKQVIPSALSQIDPFVFLDHFGPLSKGPGAGGVPPHPHAGIATITYLFNGSNRHRDSLGNDVVIRAGDLAWMHAGKGIIHSEGMKENRTAQETIHGVQIWISLPSKDKFSDPFFTHYPAKEIPEIVSSGAKIRVLCGRLGRVIAPAQAISPAFIYDVLFAAETVVEIPLADGDRCGFYVIEGKLQVGETEVHGQEVVALEDEGGSLVMYGQQGTRVMVMGGTPLNEPIVAYASFVMNSKEQIMQVLDDYEEGKMGMLEES